MPRFSFRITKTESIEWGFKRHPRIGEEVTLGDRGVFRVIESSQDPVEVRTAIE